ncbi:hypothetical protein ASPSYDRAFT_542207 [Aspergillus sydowii CBS 593.65]|uniref:Uncharacterized protein n=1 Tax=Aspergillus sydowii CBS 593.65 TaxID=1036612 RepID=A0A1L9T0X6_9EURO|nr:uncharacterized protein ASPSYDRAFT_542207 [Aspergillus sydowii CBS 593.65]OJJ53100.1 hypothetical protein ASPSYDRAFT_542207 [Aspergillus sydowii CBS 593.65]
MSQRTLRYNHHDDYHCLGVLGIDGVSEEQARWPGLWMSTVRSINAVSTQFASIYYMFLIYNHGLTESKSEYYLRNYRRNNCECLLGLATGRTTEPCSRETHTSRYHHDMCPILGSIPIMGCLVIEIYIFGMQVKHALAHIPAQPHHGETHIMERRPAGRDQRNARNTEPNPKRFPYRWYRFEKPSQSKPSGAR